MNAFRTSARSRTSVSLDQFKTLKQSISPEIEQEITGLILTDYDSGVDRIVEVASSKGVTIPLEEADILSSIEDEAEEDEDENIELDAVALTAVAGGKGASRREVTAEDVEQVPAIEA